MKCAQVSQLFEKSEDGNCDRACKVTGWEKGNWSGEIDLHVEQGEQGVSLRLALWGSDEYLSVPMQGGEWDWQKKPVIPVDLWLVADRGVAWGEGHELQVMSEVISAMTTVKVEVGIFYLQLTVECVNEKSKVWFRWDGRVDRKDLEKIGFFGDKEAT